MRYEGYVIRPPSEARSLIIQATIGCSHNKCTFCVAYKGEQFRIRKTDEVIEDINKARNYYNRIQRVFLADGDALIIKQRELLKIIQHIKKIMPECERIGIYASPRSVAIKTLDELMELKQAGLDIAYMGLESGSDIILDAVNKGVNSEQMVAAGRKIKEAGMALSLTLISGLGGKEMWEEHAVASARTINKMQPDYLGLLTLMVEPQTQIAKDIENNKFTLLTPKEVSRETLLLLEHLDSPGCVFRSNHASNYLPLRGTLNEDKDGMIQALKQALKGEVRYRDEWMRGL